MPWTSESVPRMVFDWEERLQPQLFQSSQMHILRKMMKLTHPGVPSRSRGLVSVPAGFA